MWLARWRGHTPGAVAVILLATLLVYLPALRGGFVWDDTAMLTTNPLVKLPLGLFYIWGSTALPDYYPLTYSSFWLEWRLWGMRPWGYHLTNVLLHAASAVLVWRVLKRLQLPGAWLAGLVFALHPVNVQSVAWIAERKNTLCMPFFLLSLLWYLRYDAEARSASLRAPVVPAPPGHRPSAFYRLSLLAFLLALLSKTAVVMLPVALLLIHWWQSGGRTESDPHGAGATNPRPISHAASGHRPPIARLLLRLAPFFALALALGLVTLWFQAHRAIAGDPIRVADFWTRLAGAGRAVWFYVGKLLWPRELCFVYPEWRLETGVWTTWVPVVGVAAVLVLGWWFRRGWGRHLVLVWGWFVLFLVPVLGFVDIYFHRYSLVADHWVYFAGLGLIAGAVAVGAHLFERYRARGAAGLFAVGALAVITWLGTATWQQARIYQDLGTLWADTLRKNPNCWLAHNSLGSHLADAGARRAARAHLERALAIKPDALEVLNNLASVLLDEGQPRAALVYLEKALAVAPRSAMAQYNLGNAYDQLGQTAEAEQAYRRAIALEPDHAAAHNNLGCLLYATGRKTEAIEAFARAISLRPDYADALNNLGVVFLEQGQFAQAASLLVEAVRHRPDNRDGWFNLANALLPQGRLRDASAAYRRVLALQPDHALARCRLGTALGHAGDTNAARAELETALQLQPDLAEAHHQLGLLLARAQQTSVALAHLRRAVQLQPDWPEALAGLAFTLATAPSDQDRQEAEALRLATRATELTSRTNALALEALAAALAAQRRFAEAATTAAEAAARARALGDTNRADQIQQRQRAYESGQTHRP